jgi:hypothetical protein
VLPSVPPFTVTRGRASVLLQARGQLWSTIADYLLLLLRDLLEGRQAELAVAVPSLTDAPLYSRATRRFDYSLGERDLGPVTLVVLLERLQELGGRLQLIVAANSAQNPQDMLALERLLRRGGTVVGRQVPTLEGMLIVAPNFALLSSAAASATSGQVGFICTAGEPLRAIERGFGELWRMGIPLTSPGTEQHAG